MRVAQDDTVWVTGSVDGLLQRWSNEGALLGAWLPANLPGAPIHTSSIDFDANGNVYILDTDSRSLFVYTSEMELVGSWAIVHPDGVPLSGLADVILLEDGSLAISDLFVGVVLLLHLDPPITD
jgi:hypothetical protein